MKTDQQHRNDGAAWTRKLFTQHEAHCAQCLSPYQMQCPDGARLFGEAQRWAQMAGHDLPQRTDVRSDLRKRTDAQARKLADSLNAAAVNLEEASTLARSSKALLSKALLTYAQDFRDTALVVLEEAHAAPLDGGR